MEVTYGSVCSGIEAATLAWKPLGMRASWFAEIEAFPSAVLALITENEALRQAISDRVTDGGQVSAFKIVFRAGPEYR
ncbi:MULTISPECIES: hypothetical protein [Pseudomonas]|uniref:Uncharacterized protein n=1 Tax=Pseudomonas rhizophila TaxID=2045200 RepID=A0ABN5JT34_9PSED|nr:MULTISPECIES: hypothetical protein [Pseudomonas]AVU76300.1 hypothetical protein CRX69_14210 [Pseudomonas rhizophila]